MRFSRSMGIIVFLGLMSARTAEADPIPLLFHEGMIGSGVGSINLGNYATFDLTYSSQGGAIRSSQAGSLGTTWVGGPYPAVSPTYPINDPFGFLIGVAAPGSTDQFAGPVLDVGGTVTGTVKGPDGSARWSGGYSGTATSVTPAPWTTTQQLSQLPAPLLDILNHPDHLHVDVVVDGGNRNYLDMTISFDPPAAAEAPEPSALATLLAAAAGLALRRWNARRRGPRIRGRTLLAPPPPRPVE